MKAGIAMHRRARLLRVLRARHRAPPDVTEGTCVFAWRQGRAGSGKWIIPGVTIMPIAGGAWIAVRGA
eukprot:1708549-Pyramimonas_sp.AAC.1